MFFVKCVRKKRIEKKDWVYQRCTKIKGRLKAEPSFKCNASTNNMIGISQDNPAVIIKNDRFEEIDSFSYLGAYIGQLEAVLKQPQTE